MKTGIVVHGCNLNIENWRHLAWGDPPFLLGRIPQGILMAHQFDAEVVVFGTGASKKTFRLGRSEREGEVLSEAEYSLEYLKANFGTLRKFAVFEQLEDFADPSRFEATRERLLGRIVLDTQSQNTVEEIRNAGDRFAESGIEQVMLVSSPSHIVRCLRDASDIFPRHERYRGFCDRLHAVPSRTCYEGTTPADVVVIEPPHRPDRHVVPTHRRIQRMLELQKLGGDDLVNLIEEFDDLLQRYEHKYFDQ